MGRQHPVTAVYSGAAAAAGASLMGRRRDGSGAGVPGVVAVAAAAAAAALGGSAAAGDAAARAAVAPVLLAPAAALSAKSSEDARGGENSGDGGSAGDDSSGRRGGSAAPPAPLSDKKKKSRAAVREGMFDKTNVDLSSTCARACALAGAPWHRELFAGRTLSESDIVCMEHYLSQSKSVDTLDLTSACARGPQASHLLRSRHGRVAAQCPKLGMWESALSSVAHGRAV